MTDHPMQPTPEQYVELLAEARRLHPTSHFADIARHVARLAYAAGADAELEACCEWLKSGPYGFSIAASASSLTEDLRTARRPKPPSLKQRALADLDTIQTHDSGGYQIVDLSNILRAIEALPEETP